MLLKQSAVPAINDLSGTCRFIRMINRLQFIFTILIFIRLTINKTNHCGNQVLALDMRMVKRFDSVTMRQLECIHNFVHGAGCFPVIKFKQPELFFKDKAGILLSHFQ